MPSAENTQTSRHNQATTRPFDETARNYDQWYESARGAMYDRLEKDAFDRLLAQQNHGEKLLEIGCGTGHWSACLSEKGFSVTGIDLSEKMIEIARNKHIPHCRFQVADGANLPFDDNTFDVVAAITALEFTRDAQKIIGEMARCLKPHGRLLFGMLNSLSVYNRKKQIKGQSIIAGARLFAPQELKNLLQDFGSVRMQVAGFVPKSASLIWTAPACEFFCRLIGSNKGAFITVEVKR
jgi:ubiquinone/menaquinone biosynthesis C-methylase UbiE